MGMCFPRPASDNLALSLDGIKQGHVWELLSFQFMHGGWLHLLLNCWVLYMFGREVELALGKVRFLVLYFSGCVAGVLLQMSVSFLTLFPAGRASGWCFGWDS